MLILASITVLFMLSGIFIYQRNMRKDKDDLLQCFAKNKNMSSCTIIEDGQTKLSLNENRMMPLASTMKLINDYNFVKQVTADSIDMNEKVKMCDLNRFYIEGTDVGAHVNWQKSLSSSSEVNLFEVAEGMMKFSSNACTDFIIDLIGLDVINQSIIDSRLVHDDLTYVTPANLLPGFLSKNKKAAYQALKIMSQARFNQVTCNLFEKMKENETMSLKRCALKMLDSKMQGLITNKLPHSSTKQYAVMLEEFAKCLMS